MIETLFVIGSWAGPVIWILCAAIVAGILATPDPDRRRHNSKED
jgi:hypothetical protein